MVVLSGNRLAAWALALTPSVAQYLAGLRTGLSAWPT